MTSLSLSIIPYPENYQEQVVQLDSNNAKFYFGYGKNPPKVNFETTMTIEDIPHQYIDIFSEKLTSITALYKHILNSTAVKSKFVLFGKINDQSIGSRLIRCIMIINFCVIFINGYS